MAVAVLVPPVKVSDWVKYPLGSETTIVVPDIEVTLAVVAVVPPVTISPAWNVPLTLDNVNVNEDGTFK